MRGKHVLIIFLVVVGLFGILKLTEFLRGDEGQTKVRTFLAVERDEYDTMLIEKAGSTVKLSSQSGLWQLVEPISYPGNQNNIDSTLSRMEDIRSDNIISSNANNQATFQVDSESGTKVTLLKGATAVQTFYVGKIAVDGNHTYMRKEGSNDIHTARGSLTTYFTRAVKDWRDATIVNITLDTVTQLQLDLKGREVYQLNKANGTWALAGDSALLDATKVNTLLSYCTVMSATDFVDQTNSIAGFDPNQMQATITITAGTIPTLLNLWQVDTTYLAQVVGKAQLYKISKTAYDNLTLGSAQLKTSTATPTTTP